MLTTSGRAMSASTSTSSNKESRPWGPSVRKSWGIGGTDTPGGGGDVGRRKSTSGVIPTIGMHGQAHQAAPSTPVQAARAHAGCAPRPRTDKDVEARPSAELVDVGSGVKVAGCERLAEGHPPGADVAVLQAQGTATARRDRPSLANHVIPPRPPYVERQGTQGLGAAEGSRVHPTSPNSSSRRRPWQKFSIKWYSSTGFATPDGDLAPEALHAAVSGA